MTSRQDASSKGAPRRPYRTPKLTEYGSVAKLTRTGSGTKLEGSSPNKRMA